MNKQIRIASSRLELAHMAAGEFTATVVECLLERDMCHVALAGGTTPKDVYTLLSSDIYAERFGWQNVHLYWGDERTVPPEHKESNYGMAVRALLDKIVIPPQNIHRIRGELEPEQAAEEYIKTLQQSMIVALRRFDLILLGMGEDGHTASLFPDTAAVTEKEKDVVAVRVSQLDSWRITLTLPVINRARKIVFMVSGSVKAAMVQKVVQEGKDSSLPASLVDPADGRLLWLLDREAAAMLKEDDTIDMRL